MMCFKPTSQRRLLEYGIIQYCIDHPLFMTVSAVGIGYKWMNIPFHLYLISLGPSLSYMHETIYQLPQNVFTSKLELLTFKKRPLILNRGHFRVQLQPVLPDRMGNFQPNRLKLPNQPKPRPKHILPENQFTMDFCNCQYSFNT